MQAISIDGTVIECDSIKEHSQGIILKKKEPKQAVKDESKSEKKQKKQKKEQKEQKKKKKKKKSGGSQSRTIGFIPYKRLMYVVPDDISYNIEDFEEVPV